MPFDWPMKGIAIITAYWKKGRHVAKKQGKGDMSSGWGVQIRGPKRVNIMGSRRENLAGG